MEFSRPPKGVFGLVAGFGALVLASAIAVFGMVGYTFYQANRAMNMSPGTVDKLATQIVDPNVGARQLEQQGLYKVKYGGFYLDGCRQSVLTDSFNANLSTQARAEKISDCIQQKIVETSAGANRNVYIRNR